MSRYAKAWWKSKTLWLNALVLLLATLELQLGMLREVLPVNLYALIAIALPVLNMLLRAVTKAPLGKRDAEHWR